MNGSICARCGSKHEGVAPCQSPPRVVVDGLGGASRRDLVGRVVGDRYGVTKLLGMGGMGEVFEAEHLALGRLVAIKVVRGDLAGDRATGARLRHEARVAAAVDHPNVCEVFDVGRLEDGSPFVVMERLHGRTLADRLRAEGMLPWPELRDIATQVLSALTAAHEKGIVHCDLKPENVFLGQRTGIAPVAKVLDFGIAKTGGPEEAALTLAGAGSVPGTPFYMSPEQARGDRDLDGRVDLWAVGVMLYEGLTGRRPFDASNYNALLMQILTARHPVVGSLRRGVPAGLDEVVDRALAKARSERYASGLDMIDALVRVDIATSRGASRPMVGTPKRGAFIRTEETVVLDAGSMGVTSGREGVPSPSEPGYDPEATIVDEPSFLDDSVTMILPEAGLPVSPGAK